MACLWLILGSALSQRAQVLDYFLPFLSLLSSRPSLVCTFLMACQWLMLTSGSALTLCAQAELLAALQPWEDVYAAIDPGDRPLIWGGGGGSGYVHKYEHEQTRQT